MDRHAVITGASSGIGESVAREFVAVGARVTLVARRRERLEALAKELGERVQVVAHDLAVPSTAAGWIPKVEGKFGPIDVLVNNAGIAYTGRSQDLPSGQLETMLNLNFVVPVLLTHHVLPGMIARKQGAIVNIGSVAGLTPTPWQTYYSGTKSGIGGFSEALRGELAGTGVQVLPVYPGPVSTELGEQAYEALGGKSGLNALLPEGTAPELAVRIRRALERGQARIVYPLPYLTSRWFPNLSRWLLDRVASRVLARRVQKEMA